MMQNVSFLHNYNGKLFTDCFGSVQLEDSEMFFAGNLLKGLHQDKEIGVLKVQAVRKFRFQHLSDVLAYLECGRPAHYLAEVIRKSAAADGYIVRPETRLDHIVFCYESRNIANHSALLQEWWQEKKTQNKPML